jgi:hypothetical protein
MARQAIMTEHVFYHEHVFGVNAEQHDSRAILINGEARDAVDSELAAG